MNHTIRELLVSSYLDWLNNYAAIETYAEHNGITSDQAQKFLEVAREVFSTEHPDK